MYAPIISLNLIFASAAISFALSSDPSNDLSATATYNITLRTSDEELDFATYSSVKVELRGKNDTQPTVATFIFNQYENDLLNGDKDNTLIRLAKNVVYLENVTVKLFGNQIDFSEWKPQSINISYNTRKYYYNNPLDCVTTFKKPCAMVFVKSTIGGAWNSWTPWSKCSATCESSEERRRQRECNNPSPSGGGADCPGRGSEVISCNVNECPDPTVPTWGEWEAWSKCSQTCGGGEMRRTRTCKPASETCVGKADDVLACSSQKCTDPTDHADTTDPTVPTWGEWEAWSKCTQTCGGEIRRTRTCKPASETCAGKADDVLACPAQKCTGKNKKSMQNSINIRVKTEYSKYVYEISVSTKGGYAELRRKICAGVKMVTNLSFLPIDIEKSNIIYFVKLPNIIIHSDRDVQRLKNNDRILVVSRSSNAKKPRD